MLFKKYILYFFLLFSITILGQEKINSFSKNEKIFGKILKTNTVLLGTEYIFKDFIYDAHLNSDTKLLTLELRAVNKRGTEYLNKGQIVQFDLTNNSILWNKNILYNFEELQVINNALILNNTFNSNSLFINPKSGISPWKKTAFFHYFNEKHNIGIGYDMDAASVFFNYMKGVDMNTGKMTWKRKVKTKIGWEGYFHENDSTLLIISNGLQKVNLKTGSGWEFSTKTLNSFFDKAIKVNPNAIISSNVISDSLNYFLASKIELAKINKQNGDVIWSYSLPEKETSDSKLFLLDKNLVLLNLGKSKKDFEPIGKPFLANFDVENGNQLGFKYFASEDGPIIDFKILDNKYVFILFKNKISKIDLFTGQVLNEKTFVSEQIGNLICFVDHVIAIPTDTGKIKTLDKIDASKYYIFTNTNKTVPINHDLEITEAFAIEDVYTFNNKSKKIKFIKSVTGNYLIDDEGNLLVKLSDLDSIEIIDDILYSFNENKLILVDLKELTH